MHRAVFLKDVDGMRGEAKLYHLTPALDGFNFVVVSGVYIPYAGAETFIFGANMGGKILNWRELPGSFRGEIDHALALKNAGYQIMGEKP